MRITSILAAALALACPFAPAPAPAEEVEMREVSVALGWLRNGQYAALMAADLNGHFRDEGLAVTLIDGGPGRNPVPTVGVGQAQFGISASANVFLARLAPAPVDIVAVGALGQVFPYGFITLAEPGAPDPVPSDLAGKTVGIQSDGEIFLRALAENNGVDLGSIEIRTVLATPEPLLVGQVDYFSGMINNQTYQIETEIAAAAPGSPLAGKSWKAIRFADHGVSSFGDVIFTAGSTLREDPELVRRFLRAVARGLEDTIASPGEVAARVADYPGQIEDRAKLEWRLPIQNELAQSEATREHGLLWMDPAVWERSMGFYHRYERIPRLLPVDDVMTNAFVPGL